MSTLPSSHAHYRERLQLLANESCLVNLLDRLPWWAQQGYDQRQWKRSYARFYPEHDNYATFIYEAVGTPQEIISVDVRSEADGSVAGLGEAVSHDLLGWLGVTPFLKDTALTTLAETLGSVENATVVRYRPRRRCTIRVETAEQTCYAKVFPNAEGERIHTDAIALWTAAAEGLLGFVVARPQSWDSDRRTLWQQAIPGTPAAPILFGNQGAQIAWHMGAAAGSLPDSNIAPGLVFEGTDQLRRSQRNAQDLVRRIPALERPTQELLAALGKLHDQARNRKLKPIHGAPHPNQWLICESGLGLVDFDRLAFGEPELDVATFLGEVDFEDEMELPAAELCAAFTEGYRSVAGDLDADLLRAYRAHKRLAKALRSARAVRPDGDQRAERDLMRAREALSEAL